MLLDRIEIDSCGSLERIQLGPFSHRLNAIYGPRGAGKTATLEFIRGVMLGSDRQWHRGSTGSVVWADHEGLLHCRRERDGTSAGRLSIDYVARNGRLHDHHYGYRDPSNYDRLQRMTELPRQTIDSLVVATRQTPLPAILDACRAAGLETISSVHNAPAIARLRETIATLERQLNERQLDAYHGYQVTRAELESTRARLLDELAEFARVERNPVRTDQRREELTARLVEAHDEIARLSHQESELRHLISEIHRDLAHAGELPRFENSHWQIAAAHRRELEELDSQLMRWRRTLREVCSIRSCLADLREQHLPEAAAVVTHPKESRFQDPHYHNAHFQDARQQESPKTPAPPQAARPQDSNSSDARQTNRRYREAHYLDSGYLDPRESQAHESQTRSKNSHTFEPRSGDSRAHESGVDVATERPLQSRMELVSRQIDLLVQRYESPMTEGPLAMEREAKVYRASSVSFPSSENWAESLRRMRNELSRSGHRLCDRQVTHSYEAQHQQLRLCQELLVRFIDRLIDVRNLYLRQIAGEYDVPLGQLIDAFGDWRQCHDHPHLYQWLLSDKCPPRIDDAAVHASRRKRLEQEQAELLEQLGRTVNRLDDRANEIRHLQIRLRETSPVQPNLVDARRRDACRAELVRVEERLRWLDSRVALADERARHQRRLDELLRESTRPSQLMTVASRWLAQLGSQTNVRLWTEADGSLRVDGNSLARLGEAERQTIAMAIRMAAAEELSRRGHQVPLLIDDPTADRHSADSPARLAAVLARYCEGGRQMIVFTEDRPLADAIRNLGGRVQSLATPQYIQMRYPDDSPNFAPHDPLFGVNRDLDMMWREANGLYDDPYWYQNPQRSNHAETYGHAGTDGHAETTRRNLLHGRRSTAGLGPAGDIEQGESDRVTRGPASPFFLTGDSPVDQAPSIDALAAERLTQIGIVRVAQLLAADPRILADQLGLAEVTPRVVRRWQGESQLVCTVPQLRNFDARVLVGCGFTDPKQLAQMHPGQLLENVEAFLATEQGRRILQSGTSYELSRITSWIAAANRSVARGMRHGERGARNGDSRVAKNDGGDTSQRLLRRRRHQRISPERSSARSNRGSSSGPKASGSRRGVISIQQDATNEASSHAATLRFYLERQSPVVDAPSIGPKAAARLNRLGIQTIEDLLVADPADLAARLGNRRIDEDCVLRWQHQARLVCRVPQLRGHDAELLVAVEIVEPEQLAECDPAQLCRQIDKLASSPAGRRILRGAKRPDRAEVVGWIRSAQQRRSLRAA